MFEFNPANKRLQNPVNVVQNRSEVNSFTVIWLLHAKLLFSFSGVGCENTSEISVAPPRKKSAVNSELLLLPFCTRRFPQKLKTPFLIENGMFELAELPLTLPKYVEHVPRVALENDQQLLRVNQIKDFEHLVRLKLKCSNSNFRLPPGLRELVWRERHSFRDHYVFYEISLKLEKSSICRFFCDFSILTRLSHLDLSFNQLTCVPFLPQCLQVFKINYNQLQGNFELQVY